MNESMTQLGRAKDIRELTSEELLERFTAASPEEADELIAQLGVAENSRKLTPEEQLELFSAVSPGEVDEAKMETIKEDLKKEIEAKQH